MNVTNASARETQWRAQVQGTIDPVLDTKVAFGGAGILTGIAALASTFAARSGPSPWMVGAGVGFMAAVATGTAAFLLTRDREGLVDNPAFDAEALLARDHKALAGSRVVGAQQITDEYGLPAGLSYVDEVKGVFRDEAKAHQMVDELGHDDHAVVWIRSEDDREEGLYTTGLNYTKGTDDVYEFAAVSLSGESSIPQRGAADVAYVSESQDKFAPWDRD